MKDIMKVIFPANLLPNVPTNKT